MKKKWYNKLNIRKRSCWGYNIIFVFIFVLNGIDGCSNVEYVIGHE